MEKRRLFTLSLSVVFVLLLSWGVGVNPAWGYGPIDDLVTHVDRLRQAGEIFDVATANNLVSGLKTIGTTVDAGDGVTAKQLLDAFVQEVGYLSGVLMTSTAAGQLVDGARTVAAGL